MIKLVQGQVAGYPPVTVEGANTVAPSEPPSSSDAPIPAFWPEVCPPADPEATGATLVEPTLNLKVRPRQVYDVALALARLGVDPRRISEQALFALTRHIDAAPEAQARAAARLLEDPTIPAAGFAGVEDLQAVLVLARAPDERRRSDVRHDPSQALDGSTSSATSAVEETVALLRKYLSVNPAAVDRKWIERTVAATSALNLSTAARVTTDGIELPPKTGSIVDRAVKVVLGATLDLEVGGLDERALNAAVKLIDLKGGLDLARVHGDLAATIEPRRAALAVGLRLRALVIEAYLTASFTELDAAEKSTLTPVAMAAHTLSGDCRSWQLDIRAFGHELALDLTMGQGNALLHSLRDGTDEARLACLSAIRTEARASLTELFERCERVSPELQAAVGPRT